MNVQLDCFGVKMEGMPGETGMSIFQGSGQLQLDTGTHSELEEEAVADQQRRDEELQKLLTNAFDDLYDDNDDQSTLSSIPVSEHKSQEDENEVNHPDIADRYHAALYSNSVQGPQYILDEGGISRRYSCTNEQDTSNAHNGMESRMNQINLVDTLSQHDDLRGAGGDSTSVSALHYQHCFRTSPGGVGSGDAPSIDNNERYRQTDFGSIEQLQVLYEVRVREVARLTQQLEALARESSREKDDLRRQVAFREAEKERAQLLYQQTQALLVDGKEKIAGLEKQVTTLEATVHCLENTKSELTDKLESSKACVEDLHQKILLLERGSLNNTEKHVDAFLRNVQNIHSHQLKKLEDELALAVSKLSAKELELEQQKQEAARRQQQLETLLAEKGHTLNQMAHTLEDTQRQCQNLMSQSAAQEVAHLRLKLNATERECQTLVEKLKMSQNEVDSLRLDLKQYEAVLKEELLHDGPEDSCEPSHDMGSCFTNEVSLRNELQRAMLGQKLKREEIARLTVELQNLTSELSGFKENEEQYRNKLDELETKYAAVLEENKKYKTSSSLMQRRLQEHENSIELLQTQEDSVVELKAKLFQKCQDLKEANEQCKKLKDEINELKHGSNNRDFSGEYLRFHEQKLSKAIEECNNAHKTELETIRTELEQTQRELNSVKELYINVCHSKDDLVDALQKERSNTKELQTQIHRLEAQQKAFGILHDSSSNTDQTDLKSSETQLLSQKTKIDELQAQNKLLLGKLEKGKSNLEEAQKAISETVALQAELLAQKKKEREIVEHYERELINLRLEKEQALKELENKSKDTYTARVTEEIEKAKADALLELRKNWQENYGSDASATKLKQLEEDHDLLQKQLEAAVKRHTQDTSALSSQLEEAKSREAKLRHELALKEGELSELKTRKNSSDETTVDKVKNEMMVAFASKLQAMQAQHQLQQDEMCEQVKEETIRFCVQQIRQTEAKYLISIKKYKEAYVADVEKLHAALNDTENKLVQTTEVLESTKMLLEKERLLKGHHGEWKAKVLALENQLKSVELKAEKAEKNLDIIKVKYQAAKKAVYKYKKFIDAQQKQMEKEWERINAGYQQTLCKVQQKLTKLVCKEDENISD